MLFARVPPRGCLGYLKRLNRAAMTQRAAPLQNRYIDTAATLRDGRAHACVNTRGSPRKVCILLRLNGPQTLTALHRSAPSPWQGGARQASASASRQKDHPAKTSQALGAVRPGRQHTPGPDRSVAQRHGDTAARRLGGAAAMAALEAAPERASHSRRVGRYGSYPAPSRLRDSCPETATRQAIDKPSASRLPPFQSRATETRLVPTR